MRAGASLLISAAALAACYAPKPHAGAACSKDGECPSGLRCSPTGSCQVDGIDPTADAPGGPDDAPVQIADSAIDAQLIDGCTPHPEICGDGIDQDCDGSDATCPANDTPTGAIDITAGGTFFADVRAAHDDAAPNGCGGSGGRDVFYQVVLTEPQVYYLDTLGANFDSIIRVTPGVACGGIAAGTPTCADDACGTEQSQLAVSLPSGTSCVVIDQASAAETAGNIVLTVVPEQRDGAPLAAGVQSTTGNTCGSQNFMDPVDVSCDAPGSGGKDLGFFFTACPGQTWTLDATTCNGPDYDSVLYVRGKQGKQLACNDDTCGDLAALDNRSLSGSLFYWLIVDGFSPTDCGDFKLDTNLR